MFKMTAIGIALSSAAISPPLQAADLSFAFRTTNMTPGSIYYSGIGTLTIDEASGSNGLYRVSDVNMNANFGVLKDDRSLAHSASAIVRNLYERDYSYIAFNADGSIRDFNLAFDGGVAAAFNITIEGDSGSLISRYLYMKAPTSVAIGSFVPNVISPPVMPSVPEPATWIMMIAGFGIVGAALRHRWLLKASGCVRGCKGLFTARLP